MEKILPNLKKLSGLIIIVNTFMPLILFAAIAWSTVGFKNQLCDITKSTIELINPKAEICKNEKNEDDCDCSFATLYMEMKAPLTDELVMVNAQINKLNEKIKKVDRELSDRKSKIKKDFQKLAPQIPDGIFLKKTRTKVNKALSKIPEAAYSVIGKIANPEATEAYNALNRLNKKWEKIYEKLIKPSKEIYGNWKSNILVIIMIAGIWLVITYLFWCYRRVSLGLSLILDKPRVNSF
jgi:hypothetical protein